MIQKTVSKFAAYTRVYPWFVYEIWILCRIGTGKWGYVDTIWQIRIRTHLYFSLSKRDGELRGAFICDIAITRGGTTSLVEQKLYDLKQIIVPIPWTHDQYDNAKRYVRYHNDVMINQRDSDFEQQLTNAIKHFKGFKIRQAKDKKAIVAQAKTIIREALVQYKK